ncbi:MAG: hypothetical protein NW201_13110 [Gemmatimonadales bacterium]|nr:hypothetical protein [Gemmatimonadales bacterium]
MSRPVRIAALTAVLCLAASPAPAQRPVAERGAARAAATLERLRADPPALRAFLRAFPKGGDLHHHFSGAVYAERYLAWAAEDGLCLDLAARSAVAPPCDAARGRPRADTVRADHRLWDAFVDAWSMRNWHPAQESGHRRFFSTFGRFGLLERTRSADMLAEILAQAADDRASYVETQHLPDGGAAIGLGLRTGWDGDAAATRQRLLAAGLRDTVRRALATLDTMETRARSRLGCGGPSPAPGCGVTVRYQWVGLRAMPAAAVFAQLVAGFEAATLDGRLVGVNLAQPEDDPTAVGDYALHMRMLDALHAWYPDVPIALHAGELVEGLVPREALRGHIRDAVLTGHARRIGHGVDVLDEDDGTGLLRLLTERRVLVEINLTSNDQILGVAGARHPLRAYLRAGVPVALSTDDEGVSRGSLTREYERAVLEHGVDYLTLRRMARASLEHAFVAPAERARLVRAWEEAVRGFERGAGGPAGQRAGGQ